MSTAYNFQHILISGGWPLAVKSDGSGASLTQPAGSWIAPRAEHLTFHGSVLDVQGTPSTWSVHATLQVRETHTALFQYSQPKWHDVAPDDLGVQLVGATVDGNRVKLADQTTAGKLFSVTIPNLAFPGARLRLELTGTAAATINLLLHEKGV